MQLTEEKGSLKLISGAYQLVFIHDRPFVNLLDPAGKRLADLFVLSGVHPLHGRDDTTWIDSWQVQEEPGEFVFSMNAGSSVWERKVYRLRCRPERFTYEVEIEGRGLLAEAAYFGGYASAYLRWGSGFFYSGQYFTQGFTPEPNADEASYFSPGSAAAVGLTGVPLPGRADWFFTPPPFCFSFKGPSGWTSLGVEARPGENTFTQYSYHGGRSCFYLSLDYEGRTTIDGVYHLPAIGIDFAAGEYEALQAHVDALHRAGYVPEPLPRIKPDWWREPIFCGWGEQSYLAELEKGKAPAYSQQRLYEVFLKTLEKNHINPGTVVLDDKWQAAYGVNEADPERWPDLPGFVAWQHAQGRKVLLWLKAWDPEGVPVEECITNAAGRPVAVDPTNPEFQKRLRESVRQMLSPEGYDADGFKIDFTARIPSGPGFRAYGEIWGLELMKLYLWIIYDEAKKAKPDALVITHTPHPYLAEVTDMIRLNDINKDHLILPAMIGRARVASIACPGILLDTDNWPVKDRSSWRHYLEIQAELGVPSLYYASHIDQTLEPLRDRDYSLVRRVWARYRAGLQAGRAPAIDTHLHPEPSTAIGMPPLFPTGTPAEPAAIVSSGGGAFALLPMPDLPWKPG